MIDQSKHRSAFEDALEIACQFAPEFEIRLELIEAILKFYRRGWSDGADHVLDELGRLAKAADTARREAREETTNG